MEDPDDSHEEARTSVIQLQDGFSHLPFLPDKSPAWLPHYFGLEKI
jgi:hypothetical protein